MKNIFGEKGQNFMRASKDCLKKFDLFLQNICSSSRDPLKLKTFYAYNQKSVPR